ncbi:PhzF family phenazine biosynthesis protein [Nocardia sp. NPDC005366]|uniref:PhzF family phenazine biosynthesis protein n=1 Tax=Nocardia sp. NPDC005366 TaxID=3156878 RepID=UPI0033BC9EAC
MRMICLHQVDAFTNVLFGGNPAGVVTNADALTDQEMAKIAREMSWSKTAFVLRPSKDGAAVRLRFFTPEAEVNFCGHATIGALHQLARSNRLGLGEAGRNIVAVETNAGVLDMAVTNKDEKSRVTFTAPEVEMVPYRLQGADFAAEFGVPAELLKPNGTILIDRLLDYVYIPVVSLDKLGTQAFDFSRIRERSAAEGIVVFCFFAVGSVDENADLHARGLAPNVGVDEDPFTGSMQSGLVHAAKHNGYIGESVQNIVTEQGHFIGRPGFAEIEHHSGSGAVLVSAEAVSVFSTTIEL